MTDTTQTQTSTPAPAYDAIAGSDAFSAAERAYFESGGEKLDGLTETVTETPAATQTTQAAVNGNGQQTQETQTNAEAVDGEVEILEDGKVRDTKTGRFVPHKAFHAEREKRKATEAELAQTREKFTRADERLAVLNEALKGNVSATTQQTQEAAPPDPEKDVFGFLKWQQQKIADLEGKLNNTSKNTEAQLARSALRQHYDSDVTKYKTENAHFDAARSFLIEGRHKELEAIGITDKAQRQQMIDRQEAEIALEAMRGKRRPSEVIYNLAVARGFAPKAATTTQTNGTTQQSDAAAKLDAIAKGQAASASLTTAAGGPSGELTLEALANMGEGECSKALQKIGGEAALRKMLGG